MLVPEPYRQKIRRKKIGRPKGTTRANGYKTSPGRPSGILKGWKKFERKFMEYFG